MVFLIRTIKEKKMKKNFLMVASLLIAAMLLVVSCAQEVKAPVDNNLVEVTLNTSAARSALKYDGLKIENVKYRYKLTAQWTPTGDQDPVVGNTKAGVDGADDEGYISIEGTSKTLGYVSQGLWQVEVIGSIPFGETSKDVLKGSTQVYFNKNNGENSVTVYVKPIDDTSNAGLSFDIKINDHDADKDDNAYKLVYSIEDVGGVTATGTVGEESSKRLDKVSLIPGSLVEDGFRSWTGKVTGMKPGYYRVTVSLLNGNEVVGGLTKGVLLFAGDADNAKLTGSVNSMDFVNGTLNVVYPKVSLTLTSGLNEDKGTINSEVTYTAEPKFTADLPSGYTVGAPTFTWYENGGAGNGTAATAENNTATFKKTYTTPGYKTVTCVVKYTLNVPNGNNTGKTDTVSFSVQADAALRVLINDSAS